MKPWYLCTVCTVCTYSMCVQHTYILYIHTHIHTDTYTHISYSHEIVEWRKGLELREEGCKWLPYSDLQSSWHVTITLIHHTITCMSHAIHHMHVSNSHHHHMQFTTPHDMSHVPLFHAMHTHQWWQQTSWSREFPLGQCYWCS